MTKYLDYAFLSVALLVALPACTSASSEADEPDSATELKFAAVEQTRASITSNSTITEAPFAVYGNMVMSSSSNNPTIIFNGTEVKHEGTSWNYANPQYWFPGHTYSFVALYPKTISGLSASSYENDRLAFTYTLPADYTQATDLLVATHRRKYSSGKTNAVTFNFHHTLARLNFIVRVDPSADGAVTIHELTLRNVGVTGSFSIKPAGLGSATETDDYEDGVWIVEAPSEDKDNPTALFTITAAGNDCLPAADLTITTGLSRPLFRANAVAAANAADRKDHPANPLFILPQEVSPRAEMEIKYSVGGSDIITATASLYSITVESHGGKWERGKSYTYSFTLGADEFIIFSQASVDEWDDDEGGNYVIID